MAHTAPHAQDVLPFENISNATALKLTGGFLGSAPYISANKNALGMIGERGAASPPTLAEADDALDGHAFGICFGTCTPAAMSSSTVRCGAAGVAAFPTGALSCRWRRPTLRSLVFASPAMILHRLSTPTSMFVMHCLQHIKCLCVQCHSTYGTTSNPQA